MSGREPVPTFARRRDYVVYLLAEYKIPISVTLLAAGVWATFFIDAVPSPPPWLLPFVVSVALLGLPSYFIMLSLMRRLHDPNGVLVGVADPGDPETDGVEEVYGAVEVPPDMWSSREEVGFSALEVDDATNSEVVGSFDALVTRFNYLPELEVVEVRGCEQAGLAPADRLSNSKQAEAYYQHMHAVRRAYSNLKATLHGKLTDVHDAVVMQMMLEGERAELVPDAEPAKQIERMEAAVEKLPSGPGDDRQEPAHARAAKGELGTIDEDDLSVSEGTYDSGAEAMAAQPDPAEGSA